MTELDDTVECRATLIAAPASGQGKTVLTAALARYWVNAGKRVQVFKVGPDYLDPTVLERASRTPVYNLDLWIMGEAHCGALLHRAAVGSDVILVEGVMGLHDGEPSNAALAARFGLPVTLVMDVAKAAQTAAAVVQGMVRYDPAVTIHGVVGNRVGSDNHHRLVAESVGRVRPYLGSLRRSDALVLPERHLGLVQASEVEDLDRMLDAAAALLAEYGVAVPLTPVSFRPDGEAAAVPPGALDGLRIAVARDAAFSFIYPENVHTLERMGARCVYFSPVADEAVPDCDALWLPGGYPELHLGALQAAAGSRASVAAHYRSGKPLYAECGGMMYLGEFIIDASGARGAMCAVFDGCSTMHRRFQSIGPQALARREGTLRGHAFHHSSLSTALRPESYAVKQDGSRGEPVYRAGNARFSYLHLYFASNPEAAAALFRP